MLIKVGAQIMGGDYSSVSTQEQSCCTLGQPVSYKWFGEHIPCVNDVSTTKLVAEHFARKFDEELSQTKQAANDLEKQKRLFQLDALIENGLNRIAKGQAKPGMEVKPIRIAHKENKPVFEFRWRGKTALIKGTLLRHYAAEPPDFTPCCFGLHMHIKDVSSEDRVTVRQAQNQEIKVALSYYREHEQMKWSAPILT